MAGVRPGKVVKMVHLLLRTALDREYRVIFMRRNLEESLHHRTSCWKGAAQERRSYPEQLIKGFNTQIQDIESYVKSHPISK